MKPQMTFVLNNVLLNAAHSSPESLQMEQTHFQDVKFPTVRSFAY